MLDLAALRILEFRVGDILNPDFSWPGVDDAAISAHGQTSLAGDRRITSRAPRRSLAAFGLLLVPDCELLVVVVVKVARRSVSTVGRTGPCLKASPVRSPAAIQGRPWWRSRFESADVLRRLPFRQFPRSGRSLRLAWYR